METKTDAGAMAHAYQTHQGLRSSAAAAELAQKTADGCVVTGVTR